MSDWNLLKVSGYVGEGYIPELSMNCLIITPTGKNSDQRSDLPYVVNFVLTYQN
jgi:hypothetical protein